jgi:hypothetical protein
MLYVDVKSEVCYLVKGKELLVYRKNDGNKHRERTWVSR